MGYPMRHPDVDVLGEAASEEQFKQVWEPRGWEAAPPEVVAVDEVAPEPVTDLTALTVAELREHAAALTPPVEVPARANKDEIAALIAESEAAKRAPADEED